MKTRISTSRSTLRLFAITALLLMIAWLDDLQRALIPSVQAGPVFTCKNKNGATSFSDTPCKGHVEKVDVETTPVQSGDSSSKQSDNKPAKRKSSGSYSRYVDRARSMGDNFEKKQAR